MTNETWATSPLDYEVNQHGFSFAQDVNDTFVNCLSKTQLLVILDAYEIGKQYKKESK